MKEVIEIGNKLDLILMDRSMVKEVQPKKIYFSQIADILKDSKLKINMPIEGGRIIPLEVGTGYSLCFYTSSGLYQCKATIVERYKENNMFFLVLERKTPLSKLQRRQFYRFNCMMEVQYRSILEGEEIDVKEMERAEVLKLNWSKAVMIDLSGGGMKLATTLQANKQDEVQISMVLPLSTGAKQYYIKGVVVASIPSANRSNVFEHRIEFKDITNQEREEIIKYIFEEERRRRQKN
ncbi:MAG: flagellar brake protein [Lachnospiraceae bacterium]|nr:flagellar brake protein [Lachnospiraceae bacterium]